MSVEVQLYKPTDLDYKRWVELRHVSELAFTTSLLDDNYNDVIDLAAGESQQGFVKSHRHPNSIVGSRFNAGQTFTHPRVAVATEKGEPIGFAYSAHNVSGNSPVDRFAKRLSIVKNYLAIREMVVLPDYQGRGVAKKLGRSVLEDGFELQPVTAYIWPDEIDFIEPLLKRYGFNATGEQDILARRDPPRTVKQVRMAAPSVKGVLRRLS